MVATIWRFLMDREKCSKSFHKHKNSVKAWGGLLVAICIIFFGFSDGDFSFLLTLSSVISMFSFAMVVYCIESTRSCSGISLVMIESYVILLASRLCSIIPFEGYLPYDRSGDWLYQVIEAISFALAGTIFFICRVQYSDTYDNASDTIKHWWIIVTAFVLAVLLHPSLNAFMPADVAWTFALYLEAICCLPQLFMFQKQGKVEPFMTHFLAGQALSKAISFFFWLVSYTELEDKNKHVKSYVGLWVIVMQLVQLIVMADFVYHYLRCISKGLPVQCIIADNV